MGADKPATESLNGKDAALGKDARRQMNQLMDPLPDEKKLLIDFKSLLAQAPMRSFGASGGIVPAWMKGKTPAAEATAKPTMKTVRAPEPPPALWYPSLLLLAKLWSGALSTLSRMLYRYSQSPCAA